MLSRRSDKPVTVVKADMGTSLIGGAVVAAAALGAYSMMTGPDYSAIRKDIEAVLDDPDYNYDDGSYGPVMVRLAWHNAGTYNQFDGTGGSSGAGMRFDPEANDGANAGLDVARKRLEPIKAKYPEISYSDLWSLAGTVAIESLGGPKLDWRGGRKDISDAKDCPPNGRLPDAARNADHLRAIFYRMGFNDQEIVALSGAHVLGRCHDDRSGFSGPWVESPTTFSNEYFKVLFDRKWEVKSWNGPKQYEDSKTRKLMMLPTDMEIKNDPIFNKYATVYYKDQNKFFADFSKAWTKLQNLGL